jgi:hypothetical protein
MNIVLEQSTLAQIALFHVINWERVLTKNSDPTTVQQPGHWAQSWAEMLH